MSSYTYVLRNNKNQTHTHVPINQFKRHEHPIKPISSPVFVVTIHWLFFIVSSHKRPFKNTVCFCCIFLKHVFWIILYDSSMIFFKNTSFFKINLDMSGYGSSTVHYWIILHILTQSSYLCVRTIFSVITNNAATSMSASTRPWGTQGTGDCWAKGHTCFTHTHTPFWSDSPTSLREGI